MNNDTIKQINNFTITQNRHLNLYQVFKNNFNLAIYSRNYYADQDTEIFAGDYHYLNKINRVRTRFKTWLARFIFLFIFLHINFEINLRIHNNRRKSVMKFQENNNNIAVEKRE